MFCYQCEQTGQESGCHSFGVCGKDPETAALQDLIVYGLRGLSMYAHRARELGARDQSLDVFTIKALFLTVTNVNFDPQRHSECILDLAQKRDDAKRLYEEAAAKAGVSAQALAGPAVHPLPSSLDGMIRSGEMFSPDMERGRLGADIAGLHHLILYGLKGMAAYMDHAQILGVDDEEIYAFIHRALSDLSGPITSDGLVSLALEVGRTNLKTMEHLDRAHTSAYGHPVPTKVRVTPVKGKAILITGHDLKDLDELLRQTEGKGISVYTHGEMLPAHGYPGLKRHSHLVANYGGAWQDQRVEFEVFPGAILATTNCIQKPKDTYAHRMFTSGMVGWPGISHLKDRDFGPLIEAALSEEGFAQDAPERHVTVGFGHHAFAAAAGAVVEAVKAGKIRHFLLVGGCDGAKPGRNYFTDVAKTAPPDTVVLTLGCGKYRFAKEDFGEIGGIPRLIDMGQCNDAYSAIRAASALSAAFGVGINDLPLSFVVSWFEQKAVAVLLTLLHLGVRNIRLGPSLPAFLTEQSLSTLSDAFGLKRIGDVASDLKDMIKA